MTALRLVLPVFLLSLATPSFGDLVHLASGEEIVGRLLFDKLELRAAHGSVLLPRSSLEKLVRVGGEVTASLDNGMKLTGIPVDPHLRLELGGEERSVAWEDVEWAEVGTAPEPPPDPAPEAEKRPRLFAGRKVSPKIAKACPLEVDLPLTALAGLEVKRGRYLVGDRLEPMECRRVSVMDLVIETRRQDDGSVVLVLHPRLWVRPPRDKRVDLTAELVVGGESVAKAFELAIEAEEDAATAVSVPLHLTPLEWERAFDLEADADIRIKLEVWDA